MSVGNWIREQPYEDLGQHSISPKAIDRDNVIIVSSRFRSGSVLLWNVFRQIRNATAYCQPFNEHRWCDRVEGKTDCDTTRFMMIDSWREYAAIEGLRGAYKPEWAQQNLWMDADSSNPEMIRYVDMLIEHSPGRPVLQFNRIDFRLPWFRRKFPRATIVHLYRHPRDQWMSCLVDPNKVTPSTTIAEFAPQDHYDLRAWATDLKRRFPFLDEAAVGHPYQWFYYLWKLSFLCGRRHADISLSYEELVRDPKTCLIELLINKLHLHEVDNINDLARAVNKPRPSRWRQWANEGWFQDHETQCENVLAEFFGSAGR